MGLFDSIYIKLKCPYCKEVSKMEFQTKVGECSLRSYNEGDIFNKGEFRKIYAYGSCNNFTCSLESAKESVWTSGYYGGFSRGFDCYIHCDSKGRITNNIRSIKLCSHSGIMKGVLGELKGKEDNMKVVKYGYYENKKKRWIDAKMKPMTTNGWLDKFRNESFNDGLQTYKKILYLYNLPDGAEAFKLWFIFRYKLFKIINHLENTLRLKNDEEYASIFLSNNPQDIYDYEKEADKIGRRKINAKKRYTRCWNDTTKKV